VGFSPLDDELGLLPGQLTPRLQEGLVRLSTHIPSFGKATAEFAYWTQVDVHRTTAARITEAAGTTAVALQTQATEHILHTVPLPACGPDQVVLSVDAAMVPLVHGQWAEVRTLAVGQPRLTTNTDGQAEVQTTALSYFSRLTNSTRFGELATLEIHRRGVETATRVGAVVDGAEWCQTFIDLHAPQAVRILDFPQAAEYIEAIGQTAGAGGPLLAAAMRTSLCHDLKHSGPTSVVAHLQRTAAEAGYPAETATQLAYLEKRREQMDYPGFRAEQWPIGSGMVESANKLVVEERMKGAGMHWAEGNVNPLLALRNAICNDRWAEVWPQIEDDQRRAERARRQERQRQRRLSALPEADAPASGSSGAGVLLVAEVSGPSAAALPTATRPTAGTGRPAADHPWNKAWSIRRQREIASTT
jgi:hypothetical protein